MVKIRANIYDSKALDVCLFVLHSTVDGSVILSEESMQFF